MTLLGGTHTVEPKPWTLPKGNPRIGQCSRAFEWTVVASSRNILETVFTPKSPQSDLRLNKVPWTFLDSIKGRSSALNNPFVSQVQDLGDWGVPHRLYPETQF